MADEMMTLSRSSIAVASEKSSPASALPPVYRKYEGFWNWAMR
jgi:hypothetical protein